MEWVEPPLIDPEDPDEPPKARLRPDDRVPAPELSESLIPPLLETERARPNGWVSCATTGPWEGRGGFQHQRPCPTWNPQRPELK